jgi:hypothetical protein
MPLPTSLMCVILTSLYDVKPVYLKSRIESSQRYTYSMIMEAPITLTATVLLTLSLQLDNQELYVYHGMGDPEDDWSTLYDEHSRPYLDERNSTSRHAHLRDWLFDHANAGWTMDQQHEDENFASIEIQYDCEDIHFMRRPGIEDLLDALYVRAGISQIFLRIWYMMNRWASSGPYWSGLHTNECALDGLTQLLLEKPNRWLSRHAWPLSANEAPPCRCSTGLRVDVCQIEEGNHGLCWMPHCPHGPTCFWGLECSLYVRCPKRSFGLCPSEYWQQLLCKKFGERNNSPLTALIDQFYG